MFFKDKKGQSALEYLMTYGWALIVIVIVIAALVLLINPEQIQSTSCTGFTNGLNIQDQVFSASQVQLVVDNVEGRSLSDVTIQGVFTTGGAPIYATGYDVNGGTISVGDSVTLTFAITPALAGAVNADLNVAYNNGNLDKTGTASCSGNV